MWHDTMPTPADAMTDTHYYLDLAAAFVRGRLPDAPSLPPGELVEYGCAQGLRVHKFKRSAELPRVRKALGVLRSLGPASLLDIGTGRGAFLWPLLDAFPDLPVTALDRSPQRVSNLEAVRWGGIERLTPTAGDVTALDFPDGSFDVVTILEVLEHLPDAASGAREVLRVAERFVVASVPSKPDDNPEHLRLYTAESLTEMFTTAAAGLGITVAVKCEYVPNHIVAVVRKGARHRHAERADCGPA
jgi:ubiquinone/menaquinone biosynthesis C-methylase UbiE